MRILSWRECGARDAGTSGDVPPPVRCCRCCRQGAALVNLASQSDSSVARRWSQPAVMLARSDVCRAAYLPHGAWRGPRGPREQTRPHRSGRWRRPKLSRPAASRSGQRRAHLPPWPGCGAGRLVAASRSGVPAPPQPHNRCQAGAARRQAGCAASDRATVLAAMPSAAVAEARWGVPVAHSSGARGSGQPAGLSPWHGRVCRGEAR
jgi:hypothetical protein